MDDREKLRLTKVYSELPEKDLIDMLLIDEGEYDPEVYQLLVNEMGKRKIEKKVQEQKQKEDCIKKGMGNKTEKGFIWGNIWIFVNFLAGAFMALYGLFYLITSSLALMRIMSSIAFVVGLLFIIDSYGLLKRKKWAFVLVIIFIIGYILFDLSALFLLIFVEKTKNPGSSILETAIKATIGYCWYIYFYKRKSWFN